MMKARITATILAALFCAQASAATATGSHQYIVRLKYLFVQPNASAAAPIKSVVPQLGGQLDFDLWNWLVITIPDAAYQAIRSHPAVKYLQRVVSGPFVPSTTASAERDIGPDATPAVNSLPPWTSGTYAYDGAGNISAMGSEAFIYDGISRLVQANVQGGRTEWYTYDPFGNLTYKTTYDPTTTPPTTLPVDLTTNTATNHLATESYDAAGDLTGDSSETNAFDPVNMQLEKDISSTGTAELYVYDASDERIGVLECQHLTSGTTCPTNAPMFWSLRDENGEVLRQYEGWYGGNVSPSQAPAWAWLEDYVYRDGLLLGAERVPEEGGRRHFHLDHLGTPRLVTNSAGGEMAQHDYYPFGVEIPPSFQDTANGYDREEPMRFTGHERDFNVATTSENSNYNDFMHARPTVPQWGRFLSPDPVGGDPHYPQSWNHYSYVVNNPLLYTDPTGLSDDPTQEIPGAPCPGAVGPCFTYRDVPPVETFFGWLGGNDANALAHFYHAVNDSTVKQEICSAIPSGRTTGVSGGIGLVGSPGVGGEVLVNYNSGQVSGFGLGGLQFGWNGVASGSVYSGFVYGLNASNSNYSGGFTGGNAALELGGYAAFSSGGLTAGPGGLVPTGAVKAGGVTLGATLVGPSFGATVTNYTKPVQLGKYWPLALNPLDESLYLARQACK